ncbi:MAG TPA: hypothetical protein VFF67_00850 [Thermoplasmata archaeon]|nr:hypothetical protein [Thermoplasmata archaeon]
MEYLRVGSHRVVRSGIAMLSAGIIAVFLVLSLRILDPLAVSLDAEGELLFVAVVPLLLGAILVHTYMPRTILVRVAAHGRRLIRKYRTGQVLVLFGAAIGYAGAAIRTPILGGLGLSPSGALVLTYGLVVLGLAALGIGLYWIPARSTDE